MGQAQGAARRERGESGSISSHHHVGGGIMGHHRGRQSTFDEECPVEMKIAKYGGGSGAGTSGGGSGSVPLASRPSMQYINVNEYPVVIKWSAGLAKSVSIKLKRASIRDAKLSKVEIWVDCDPCRIQIVKVLPCSFTAKTANIHLHELF